MGATTENSGFGCSYYEAKVDYPINNESPPYTAECGDLIDSLEMTPSEANIFKEVWRSCNERLGRKKKGNSQLRSAEKILWASQRNYELKKRGKR